MSDYIERYSDWLSDNAAHRSTVMRWALGVVMFLAGMHKFFEPMLWQEYMAPWLLNMMILPAVEALMVLGVAELVLGVAILADYRTEWTATLSALAFIVILFNLLTTGQHLDVLFMNVGLFGLALATALDAAG
jgi:uncharacterized membrane protein YphA (DoxX/SURF4 family)